MMICYGGENRTKQHTSGPVIGILLPVTATALWLRRRIKLKRARRAPARTGRVESTAVRLKNAGDSVLFENAPATVKERAPQIAAVLLGFAAFAAPTKAQEQPVPLQFNVAYRCSQGITYKITKCTGSGYKEVCFWREEQNGQLVTEAYTQRVYMGGRLAACKVDSTTPASRDYTKDLPSVERIESELKGSDPTDTLARQAAIFDYLQQYIQRIKEARDYRGPYSPGEQKLLTDYARAGYDLTQSYTKTHTPAELTAFNRLKFRYEINDALNWIKQIEGQQAADTYKGAEASLAQSYKRNQDRIQQQMKPQQGGGRSSIAGDPVLDPMGIFAGRQANMENDPQTRRCLELGGTIDECEGASITNLGKVVEAEVAKSIGVAVNPARPLNGVILVGSYHSRTELPRNSTHMGRQGLPAKVRNSCERLPHVHPSQIRRDDAARRG